MSEWLRFSVTELERKGILLVQDGNHGNDRPRPDEFVPDGVAFIRAADMSSGRVSFSSASRINEVARSRIRKGVGQSGDVLLSHKGTVGRVAMVPMNAPEFVCSPQTTFWRSLDDFSLDRIFLRCFMSSPDFTAQLDSRKGETDMAPYVSLTEQRKLTIVLPPILEQRAIAAVLGALDDKIESNRRIWGLSTELVRTDYELLVSEESGSSCRMRDICDFNLRTRKPGGPSETIRYIDISSVEAGVVTGESETNWADAPSRARRSVIDGDLIFSTVRPARMAYSMMFDPDLSTVVSTGFAVMSPKGVPSTLLFAIVSDAEFGKYCESVSQGSAYPAVSPDSMGNYEVQLPDKEVLSNFGARTEPILRRAHQGLQENRALSRLRDALLPELLSGRLRVKDAESMVEGA